MDNSIFEKIIQGSATQKLGTEPFLTDYYRACGLNSLKAALKAEETLQYFIQFTSNELKEAILLNIPYIFSEVTKNVLTLNPKYFPVKQIQEKLIKMDWRDFEYFSKDILQVCFNAFDVETTPPTADGGIDFTGKIPITSVCNKHMYGFVEVYGQSKRYTDNVGIYDIKAFEAFANSKKRNNVHPTQLFLFFTSSDFAKSSLMLLKEIGFIGFSGNQLANLIYIHKEIFAQKSSIYKRMFTTNNSKNEDARPEEKFG